MAPPPLRSAHPTSGTFRHGMKKTQIDDVAVSSVQSRGVIEDGFRHQGPRTMQARCLQKKGVAAPATKEWSRPKGARGGAGARMWSAGHGPEIARSAATQAYP